MSQHVIAITGGIGSGKSIISSILRLLGYKIYDCDSNAKHIMNHSRQIKESLANLIDKDTITPLGEINREKLGKIVFNNPEKLAILNQLVHSAVINDFSYWKNQQLPDSKLFIETAILYQSGIDKIVAEVWEIIAPEEIRIRRVMKRNNFNREQVVSRIKSQEFKPKEIHNNTKLIINNDQNPILPQIIRLLN